MSTRRGNNEGTIYQRKDGRWCAAVMTRLGRKYIYGKTRREVYQKLRKLQSEADQGILPPERLTVNEYMHRWLQDVARPSVRANTFRSYEQLTRVHILPALGKLKLTDLQPAHIQKLHADLQKQGKSRSTVERVHRVLHNALNQALAWGYIHRNVASIVHPPTPQAHKLRTLTPDQVRLLLDTARGTRWEALLMLAISTGMRQGELLGLKWEDMDFEMGILRVQRQLAKGRVFTEPKTRTARRAINLPNSAVAILQAHRERQGDERKSVGVDWDDQDLVFCTHYGTPLNARNVIRDFKILLERARLPDIRFHDLRHTAATLMLLQGVPAKVVQGRLGHGQISLTLDTYSHLLPSMDRDAADRIDILLDKRPDG